MTQKSTISTETDLSKVQPRHEVITPTPPFSKNLSATQDTETPPTKPKSMQLLYIVSAQDTYQHQKIKDMAQAFGQNFVIIWDNKEHKECPEQFKKHARCVDAWRWADERRGLTSPCCGIQKAVAWATDNRNSSDYFWFMEDDVHFTDLALLERRVHETRDASADLLLQNRPQDVEGWYHAKGTKEALAQRQGWGSWNEKMQRYVLLNLFRTSTLFLTRLGEDFRANNNTWAFFETYFLAVAELHHLTTSWDSNPGMRFRPCWREFPTPGLYHPAKWRDGEFMKCEGKKEDKSQER